LVLCNELVIACRDSGAQYSFRGFAGALFCLALEMNFRGQGVILAIKDLQFAVGAGQAAAEKEGEPPIHGRSHGLASPIRIFAMGEGAVDRFLVHS